MRKIELIKFTTNPIATESLKPQIWIAISDYRQSKSLSLNWKLNKKTDLVGRISGFDCCMQDKLFSSSWSEWTLTWEREREEVSELSKLHNYVTITVLPLAYFHSQLKVCLFVWYVMFFPHGKNQNFVFHKLQDNFSYQILSFKGWKWQFLISLLEVLVIVSLAQLVGVMHKICNVWGSNSNHHQKKENWVLSSWHPTSPYYNVWALTVSLLDKKK